MRHAVEEDHPADEAVGSKILRRTQHNPVGWGSGVCSRGMLENS